MSFYTALRAAADKLLRDKGQSMTLHTRTAGAYDPATGAVVTPLDLPCFGAIFDYPAKEIDGTQIQHRDRKVILSAEGLTVVPDTAGSVIVQGVRHAIIDVKPLEPGGTAVIYTLQVRKGS